MRGETCLTTGLIIPQWQPFQTLRSHAENQRSVRGCVFLQWVVLWACIHTPASAHKHTSTHLTAAVFCSGFGNPGNIPLWAMLAHKQTRVGRDAHVCAHRHIYDHIPSPSRIGITCYALIIAIVRFEPHIHTHTHTHTIKQGLPAKAPEYNTHLINIHTIAKATLHLWQKP